MTNRNIKLATFGLFIFNLGLALIIFISLATKQTVIADTEISLYLKSFESAEQVKQYIESNGIFEQLDPMWWYQYDHNTNSCHLVQLLDADLKVRYLGKTLSLTEVTNACITYKEAVSIHK